MVMNRSSRNLFLIVIAFSVLLLFVSCNKSQIRDSNKPGDVSSSDVSSVDDTSGSDLPFSDTSTPSGPTSDSDAASSSATSEVEDTTATPASEPSPTITPTPEPTASPTPAPTNTPSPVPTATPVPTPAASTYSPDGRSGAQLNSPYVKNGVILVNKQHWVSREYAPLPASENKWSLQADAWNAWKRMESDAKAAGLTLRFVSGYRTYDYQDWLFNDYASRDPQGANRYSARPGQSEHQTGLALDIDNGNVGLVSGFADTAEGQWLWANAWKYGWILRYPQGKEQITGYIFEPWHYRYVGENVAAAFGPNNVLTLEEYLNELPGNYQ